MPQSAPESTSTGQEAKQDQVQDYPLTSEGQSKESQNAVLEQSTDAKLPTEQADAKQDAKLVEEEEQVEAIEDDQFFADMDANFTD